MQKAKTSLKSPLKKHITPTPLLHLAQSYDYAVAGLGDFGVGFGELAVDGLGDR